jgi:ATP-dependent RNA helicase DeaD
MKKFEDLGLSQATIKALEKKGFEEPTSIQEKVIPILLEGETDIVGQAQTGTGKTAAFGLPLLERLEENAGFVQALILCPTRELAIQVSEEINSLRGARRLSILPVYGGQAITLQLRGLKRGADIVVGTPGRVIDHIKRGSLKIDRIAYLILDEADEMLNMGFIDEVETIIREANDDRRTLLFSATMPDRIMSLAKKYMSDYKVIAAHSELTTSLTEQIYFEVSEQDKFEALCRIIDIEPEFYGLIFCRTKVDVDTVANKLIDRGYDAEALHGDLSQYQRERIMDKFRSLRISILVATDVAARGIDVANLTHVINYSLPQDPESYVHRIGRTGRAGHQGRAVTFVTPEEYRKLLFIKRIAKTDIRKEQIPDIKEVISFKKMRLKDDLIGIIEEGGLDDYRAIAGELIEEDSPENIVAALIKLAFEEDFDESSYSEIKKVSVNVNMKGKTRLFVALGRKHNMSPKELLSFIQNKTKVDPRRIQDLRIYEEFSFINVPFEDAEIILDVFNRENRGKRPIVSRAKEKKDSKPSKDFKGSYDSKKKWDDKKDKGKKRR